MNDKLRDKLTSLHIEVLTGNVDYSQYYTVRSCAEAMNVNMMTVRRKIDKGELPAKYNDIGEGKSQYLIPKEAVEVATITKEVIQVARPVGVSELMLSVSNAIHEGNRETNERLDRIEKLLLEQKKSAPQLSFIGKLRSLFGF